jgi:DNA-binding winged helix-turn-helix (wHTH) protein/tetratricopeptide (TPR) repeat protein
MTRSLPLTHCTVDLDAATVRWADRVETLTDLERRLLELLASRNGAVVSQHELITDVWRYHPRTQTRAVALTVSRLRKKIEVHPEEPRHLRTVRGVGLQLIVAPAPTPVVPSAAPARFGPEAARALMLELDGPAGLEAERDLHAGGVAWGRAAEQTADPEQRAWLLLAAARAFTPGSATPAVGALLACADEVGVPTLATRLVTAACARLSVEGHIALATELIDRHLASPPTVDVEHSGARIELQLVRLNVLLRAGHVDRFHALAATALRDAVLHADRHHTARVLDRMAAMVRRSDDLEQAEQLLLDALEIMEASQCARGTMEVRNNLGLVALRRGNLEQAEAAFRRVLSDLALASNTCDTSLPLGNLGVVLLIRGDATGARELFETALAHAQRAQDHFSAAASRIQLAKAYVELGDLAAAEQQLVRALHTASRAGLAREIGRAQLWLGWLQHRKGDPGATHRYAAAWDHLRNPGRDEISAGALCAWWSLLEPRRAEELWQTSQAHLARAGADAAWLRNGEGPIGPWSYEVRRSADLLRIARISPS